ncbi:hypothetical protein [Candidatus Liberibacter solanacearum]|uniref:hypothetical protein n=1 Tax=Candidatus Liberibacter solanacearum TaxID=556287 RepID=UPI00117788D9|nr:hypothetical protein [Candidatus Liberibacter solanacearum]
MRISKIIKQALAVSPVVEKRERTDFQRYVTSSLVVAIGFGPIQISLSGYASRFAMLSLIALKSVSNVRISFS